MLSSKLGARFNEHRISIEMIRENFKDSDKLGGKLLCTLDLQLSPTNGGWPSRFRDTM